MPVLNINTSAAVRFTNELEQLSRSALPVAIRGALNNTAFDVKKNSMPIAAQNAFKQRQQNFFRANSRVEVARGFNTKTMRSMIGFTSTGLKGGATNYAVRDLQEQEYGGTINKRSYVPLDQARGGSGMNVVRPRNRLSAIKNIVNAGNVQGNSVRGKFAKAVQKAGKGGYVISNNKYGKILFRVKSVGAFNNRFRGKMGGGEMKLEPLYSYKEKRSIHVRRTAFMENASLVSLRKMERFYIVEAKKQISKVK